MLALRLFPVSVIIYACDLYDMKNFGMGVYRKSPDECAETEFVHAVTVIGYGTSDKGEDYWEIKNSYSTTWGDNGFIKFARNTEWDDQGGQNGVLEKPIYVQ